MLLIQMEDLILFIKNYKKWIKMNYCKLWDLKPILKRKNLKN